MDIKHTILMITYNQEDCVREALDCLFRQGIPPYEVIIADDCSIDKTRDIILEFKKKYPNIIRPVFHEENLGIYKNLNYIINNIKISGDIVSILAGDDLYKDHMLLTFNRLIKKENLNPQDEKFLLMTNQLHLLPDGTEREAINNYTFKNKNYLKLKLRNRMGNRYTGISSALFKTMNCWNLDIGLMADYLHAFDLYTECDNFYFINKSFPVYRLDSGVTAKNKKYIFSKSWIQVVNYILTNRSKFLDKLDVIYLNKNIVRSKLELDNSFKNKTSFLQYYLLSFGDVLNGDVSFKSYVFESSFFFPKSVVRIIKKLIGR